MGGMPDGMEKGLMLEAEKQDGGAPSYSDPPLGMNFLSSSAVTSYISVGSEIALHDLNLLPLSMSALNKPLYSRNVDCYIPKIIGLTLDPLVAFCFSDGSSSGNNSIAYDLRSQIVLAEPSTDLGKMSKGSRGRGGGTSSRGRGRKSKLDHAKEKALFDQAEGTQLSITRVLRESNPLSVCS